MFTMYRQLLEKINDTVARLEARQAAHLRCGEGCADCCGYLMSFYPVEIAHMADAIAGMDEIRRNAIVAHLTLYTENRQDSPCPLLDKDGRCLAYEVRPVLCRSHGLLLNVAAGADELDILRSCDLNFTGIDISTFEREDTINQQLISTLLHRINTAFVQNTGMPDDLRLSPLALVDLLNDTEEIP